MIDHQDIGHQNDTVTVDNSVFHRRTLVAVSDGYKTDLLSRLLAERGLTADVVNDPMSAIEAYQRLRHPFVIVHASLPGMEDFNLCRAIRAVPGNELTVILVVIDRNHLGDLHAVLDAGADDFIHEPINEERLRTRIAIAERRIGENYQRERAAAELTRLSLVAKRTDNLVIITDSHGRIEWVNDGFERVTQYKLDEVLGKRPGDFLQGEETDLETVKYMRSKLDDGEGFNVEIVNYNKSGRKYWLDIEVRPIHDDHGNVTNFMAVESDITEMKLAREREVEIGSRIQESLLLGRVPPGIDGAAISALTIPSQRIDGDFFDIHKYGSRRFDVMIGDVMGKGVPASLIGAATKSEFLRATSLLVSKLRSERLPEAEEIVNQVHREVTGELVKLETFVTACLAQFNLDENKVCFVNSGHTGTLHYSGNTGEARSFHGLNLPLGVKTDEQYTQICIPIDHGDVFLFYSDGVTEARSADGSLFGQDRLMQVLSANAKASPQEIIDAVREAVLIFSKSGKLLDDFTCIAVKIE